VSERAWPRGPFLTLAQLKRTLVEVVTEAERDEQLALLRSHPELAGKAMAAGTMTAESSHEQGRVGLTACTPAELAQIAKLNAAYRDRFGFPFMLAVRGPRGTGLTKAQIIATFERRLENHPDFEFAEALRNVHRVAELRLDDRFGVRPVLGEQAWDCAELLARTRTPASPRTAELTVTYLTDAHRAAAAQLVRWMRECGFDRRQGRRGRQRRRRLPGGDRRGAKTLLTGSHYDTVRNGGRYDGRLGIFVPMIAVRELSRPAGACRSRSRSSPSPRRKASATRRPSSARARSSASSIRSGSTRSTPTACRCATRCATPACSASPRAIAKLKRKPADYLGFVEVHIEQGPVLNELGLPLGVVTSINGGVRFAGEVRGMASHAGTTPMTSRRDAAAAVAELAGLPREARRKRRTWSARWACSRCRTDRPTSSRPLQVHARHPRHHQPGARCLRRRRPRRARAICDRRGLSFFLEETMRVAASPSAPQWQARWERAVSPSACPCTACRAAPATTR
jgi:N-carbamoyl-L-amino-acid hydrolase